MVIFWVTVLCNTVLLGATTQITTIYTRQDAQTATLFSDANKDVSLQLKQHSLSMLDSVYLGSFDPWVI
jgi:hypothetical protein